MAWRCGSLSRSFISTARAASVRSSPTLPRVRPSPFTAPPQQPRSFSFTNLRTFAELGCTQSLLPLHSVVTASRLTSHLTVDARACCELSQGTLCRTCQDRYSLLAISWPFILFRGAVLISVTDPLIPYLNGMAIHSTKKEKGNQEAQGKLEQATSAPTCGVRDRVVISM